MQILLILSLYRQENVYRDIKFSIVPQKSEKTKAYGQKNKNPVISI